MIKLYWSLMQIDEDSKDVNIPLAHLSFLDGVKIAELDPETFFKFT